MTEYDDENDGIDENQQPQSTSKPNWRRKLEQEAAEGKQAKADKEALEKRLAFAEAGLTNLKPEQRQLLENGHRGEWTAEALRQAAEGAGFLAEPQQTAPAAPDADLQALDRVSQAQAGAGVAPAEDAVAGLYAADRQGGRQAVLDKIRADGIINVV